MLLFFSRKFEQLKECKQCECVLVVITRQISLINEILESQKNMNHPERVNSVAITNLHAYCSYASWLQFSCFQKMLCFPANRRNNMGSKHDLRYSEVEVDLFSVNYRHSSSPSIDTTTIVLCYHRINETILW